MKSWSMRAQKLAMGLRSLRMKRPLVAKAVEESRGRTLVGVRGAQGARAVQLSHSTVKHAVGWAQTIPHWCEMTVIGWCQRLFQNATPGR